MASRKKTMYVWLGITAALFAVMYAITQFSQQSKEKITQSMLESCEKNMPFSEAWQNDMVVNKLDKMPVELVAKQYCNCTLGETFTGMNDQAIRQMTKATQQELIELLGGEKAMHERHLSCLKNIKP